MWSDAAQQKNRTLPSVPPKPPQTVFGAFETVPVGATQRDIFAYWKQINRSENNGPRFRYEVKELTMDGNSM